MAVCKARRLLMEFSGNCYFQQPVRYGWTRLVSRGKPPDEARSFAERMKEIEAKDPELDKDINIGFPRVSSSVSEKTLKDWRKHRKEKEQAARLGKLLIDRDTIQEQYERGEGLTSAHDLAKHYGIFRDLFDNAFFYPNTRLQLFYDYDDNLVTPVYRGNRIDCSQTTSQPAVHIDSDPSSLWTLVMINPDGHLQDNSAEVLHWFISNIPGGDVEEGEVICDYLPPFPVKGTGLHRLVFVLYKQEGRLDFSEHKRPVNWSLEERTFKNLEFYRDHQEEMTPAGLAFYQTEWDDSVTSVFHNILGMAEPSFEFVHPPVYHPAQVKFPHRQPFNLYLDRYRDIKDIREEVLREKLKSVSPFSGPNTQPKFPNLGHLPPTVPQWLKAKIHDKRLRKRHWAELNS